MQTLISVVSLAFAGCMVLSSCVLPNAEVPITQLEVREIQTREFDTPNVKLVMKSMMNVLQDEGFIIKNAVMDLGLICAEKNIDLENKVFAMFKKAFAEPNDRWDKQQILEASANVSEFGDKTRVRVTFQKKTLDNFGCPSEIQSIRDPAYYQNFFEKVSKGIFIQEQGL